MPEQGLRPLRPGRAGQHRGERHLPDAERSRQEVRVPLLRHIVLRPQEHGLLRPQDGGREGAAGAEDDRQGDEHAQCRRGARDEAGHGSQLGPARGRAQRGG